MFFDLALIVPVVYAALSILSFLAYAIDKWAAMTGRWRIAEGTLHMLALLGGWPGALIAQQVLRHKTRKLSYQVIFWSIVALHGLAWAEVLRDFAISRAAMDFVRRMI